MSDVLLPEAFKTRMREQLKDEYEAFIDSYKENRTYGLRCNLLKQDIKAFPEGMPFTLSPVSWTGEGFYYDENERPGKHAFHEAGAYYIQEPGAMLPASVLNAKPGETILDLCAAPGGKSTQIGCNGME